MDIGPAKICFESEYQKEDLRNFSFYLLVFLLLTTASAVWTAVYNGLFRKLFGYTERKKPPIGEIPDRIGTLDTCCCDGRIKLLHPIGHGVSGTVFLARQIIDAEWVLVAYKTVFLPKKGKHCEDLLKLLEEIKRLSFHCPYILRILHYEYIMLPSERVSLSSEYCEEGSLRSIAEKGPMHYLRLYDWVIQVVRALVFLHDHDIVHRDIKGDNVLLTKKSGHDCIKIGDFDFSKLLDQSNSRQCNVSGGVGTLAFMAPEVIQGEAGDYHVGRRADIWSLGCMIVELSSGGRIRHFRREDGRLVDARSLNLAWEIAQNGAVPEVWVGDSEMRMVFYDGLLHLCFRPLAKEQTSDYGRARPSASELLYHATHKVCRTFDTLGFPNTVDLSAAPMTLLQPWVRDRVLDLSANIYLLNRAEIYQCKSMLISAYNSFIEAIRKVSTEKKTLQRSLDNATIKHLHYGTAELENCHNCIVGLLLVSGSEIYPTGQPMVSMSSPDGGSKWCHFVQLRCIFKESDLLSPENLLDTPPSDPTALIHQIPNSTSTIGITEVCVPDDRYKHQKCFSKALEILRTSSNHCNNKLTLPNASAAVELDLRTSDLAFSYVLQ